MRRTTVVVVALIAGAIGPTAAQAEVFATPSPVAAARKALNAKPDDPDFCIGIQLKGNRYTGRCPVGAPLTPMLAVNRGFQRQYGGVRLRGDLRAAGLRSIDTQRMDRLFRSLNRDTGKRPSPYDWAKEQRKDNAKKYVSTCLVYGVLGAVIGGITSAIFPDTSWLPQVLGTAASFCVGRVADPKLRAWLRKHRLSVD